MEDRTEGFPDAQAPGVMQTPAEGGEVESLKAFELLGHPCR